MPKTFLKIESRIRSHLDAGEFQAASDLANQALEASGWPDSEQPIPLPEDLSKEQTELATMLAPLTPLYIGFFAIPISARVRQRWLGIKPGGPLEELHSFQLSGQTLRWPLWRYLIEEDVEEESRQEFIADMDQLPRLQVLAELVFESYEIDLEYIDLLSNSIDAESGESAQWATAFADELLILFSNPPSIEANQFLHITDDLKNLAIFPILRKNAPIEARWDGLVPVTKNKKRMEEIVAGLPSDRRESILVARLGESMAHIAVIVSLDVLAYFPSPAIATQLQAWLKDKDWERNLGRETARAQRKNFKSLLSENPDLKKAIDGFVKSPIFSSK